MGRTIQISGLPSLLSAEKIRMIFLEHEILRNIVGKTIYAIQVKMKQEPGSRAYAIVQFTDNLDDETLMRLRNFRPRCGNSYLKFWDQKDIVPNPRTYDNVMEGVDLNLGCQVSQDKFSVLWKAANVCVKFGTGLKIMHLLLCHELVEYRLQLYYDNIWQIVLYDSGSHASKLLLIQLYGAPRIFKKLADSEYSYFQQTPDDQWVRTTDFTPSLCIGQSSGICLRLPHGIKLPDFERHFVYYKESKKPFFLETGVPFCENMDLVPIMQPPRGLELPYRLLFKHQSYCFFKKPKSPVVDDDLVHIHRVQVTPTKVYFHGPEVNVSNRVLRNFHDRIDNFLRVSFVEEDWSKMYASDLSPRGAGGDESTRTKLYDRILSTLRNGITIGSKKFEFLAFSSSQLRENSLWMFAPTDNLNANDIRQWMGDFSSILNVAKYAARLGQFFGSSTETLSVSQNEVEKIPDVELVRDGTTYIFSDGIGKISVDFARRVAIKCGLRSNIPSAFQIRYGGYKGVVAIDPASSVKMSLRPSMLKYQSDDTKLNVLGWSKYQPCFLNRQIITLLSTLGVADHVFEKKQSEAVAQLNDIIVDPFKALEALDLMSLGENTYILKEMLKCGYKPDEEPFLAMMLQTLRSSQLLDLRIKSRIFIRQARNMMGCLDETATLEYGQVFVQFSGAGQRRFYEESIDEYSSTDHNYVVKGKVAVAKNPCLHPGDLRVLEAIDVPALHHMVNCIVFPQKGMRPHPNECSGSDLDGDIYFVCWDPDMIPPKQFSPMDYNPAPATRLDHEVTIEEVQEYFTNYILNESLGMIANAHIVFADKEPFMAMSSSCLELAKLHSVAVDFPKTGVPAQIPPKLRVKEYPDFMEKLDKPTFESKGVIGKLFREVKHVATDTSSLKFTKEVARSSYDADMEVDGFRDYIEEAFECKTKYDRKLGNLMDYYGIKTEGEILSRAIMKMSKTFDRRKSAEAVGAAVKSLRNEARSWFKKGSKSGDANAMASAWYHVTYHPDFWGHYNKDMKMRNHYISFPWCVYDKLVQIKNEKTRKDYSNNSSGQEGIKKKKNARKEHSYQGGNKEETRRKEHSKCSSCHEVIKKESARKDHSKGSEKMMMENASSKEEPASSSGRQNMWIKKELKGLTLK
ncbi:RNA-directed RNA polymerase [Salvia divinorum]|uniref:RNA-dependent RNA polymerase n=1 Tax=Salvia divinorum TaxID=28513 RepID=A0ABD1IMV5_SALDI